MMLLKEKLYISNVITGKNKINGRLTLDIKYRDILKEIMDYTQFLDETYPLKIRIYCIVNDIIEIPLCPVCNTNKAKFQGHFHNGYFSYCSNSCANVIGSSKLRRTEKSLKERAKRTSETRKINGSYNPTTETRFKMSLKAKSKEVQNKKKLTNLERYGVENPGVLGAYTSKAAYNYIIDFLERHCYDERHCYFHGGGVNGKEFYQNIYNEFSNKMDYISYDLVVFETETDAKNKNLHKIVCVLEYNGPWHYTLIEMSEDPDGPATPYKNNKTSKTKRQTYEQDNKKYKLMKQYTNEIFVYWEKDKTLERIL